MGGYVSRNVGLLLLALIIVGAGYGVYTLMHQEDHAHAAPVDVGGPFSLIDQEGNRRRDTDFLGRHMLVYFGFTNCPDICPVDLSKMTSVLADMDPQADVITPVFITIDPERDTPERMADFAASFYPGLVALTGTQEDIDRVAKAYKVYSARHETGHTGHHDSAKATDAHGGAHQGDTHRGHDYQMNHSALFYLMGPDGRYVTHIGRDASHDHMKALLERALAS